MKAHWDNEDFARMTPMPLTFTDADVDLIQRGLRARARHGRFRDVSGRRRHAATVRDKDRVILRNRFSRGRRHERADVS